MAIILAQRVNPYEVDLQVWKWVGLAQGDTGSPVPTRYYSDISVMAKASTPGTGTLGIDGSNDPAGSGYGPLHDSRGFSNVLAITLSTAFQFAQVLEAAFLIRPALNGGAGASGCDVWLKMRGR